MLKYLKPDSELGYVEDSAEINYLKFNNMRHTILGCMLGDFNEQGEYVVSSEIAKELIEMPKYISETMDNMDVCLSELKLDKQISFLVTFEEDKATLSLIEKLSYEANIKLNSGTYSNINEYVLDTVQTSGEVNKNVIYRRWNINQFQGNVLDIFSCDASVLEKYFGIVNRFKYLLAANSLLLEKEEELEELEAEYANEIFKLLKVYPELEKVVLNQLRLALAEKQDFLQLNKPNYAKTLNEILDNAIMQNLNILTEEQKLEFEKDLRNLYLQAYLKRSNLLDVEVLNGIETLSVQQLLSGSLQEIGAEFVKHVKNYKEIDKVNNVELKKLLDYLVAQKLIEIKKAEEEKTLELVKKAQEKAAEQSKEKAADAAKAKGADKAKAKGGDKAKSKGGDKKAKKDSKSDKKDKSSEDKKKAEEEKKKKEEEERKKREEEEARRRKKKRNGRYVGVGLISGMVVGARTENISIDSNGRINYSSGSRVVANARNSAAGVKSTITASVDSIHTASVGGDGGLGV